MEVALSLEDSAIGGLAAGRRAPVSPAPAAVLAEPVTLLDPVAGCAEISVDVAWSPDGTHLAITGSNDPFSDLVSAPIYIVQANGSGFSAVPGVTAARDTAWRPQ